MNLNPTVQRVFHNVWATNLDFELARLYYSLWKIDYRVVSIDTEFPGTVFTLPSDVPKHKYVSSPDENYQLLKKNADALKLIQLGLTLMDSRGSTYTWQFNFKDFDPAKDLHNVESIAFLLRQGIDFRVNKTFGIDTVRFALRFKPILEVLRQKRLRWVTFHGSYDFSLLIKSLGVEELPNDIYNFMKLVGKYVGFSTIDLKVVTRRLDIHGGLERVAKQFGVHCISGLKHQAGSDSLLVMEVFRRICFKYPQIVYSKECSHKIYGLIKLHSRTHEQPSLNCNNVGLCTELLPTS